ncbi:MAG: DUF4440 domain-containing protein [Woeseiaceae bacterium]
MTGHHDAEKSAIDLVVSRFFSAFTNVNGKCVNLDGLTDIFLAGAVIIKTCGEPISVYSLAEFVAPRKKLLNGGELEGFSEKELWERTDIFGSVAQRLSLYKKSGVLFGKSFASKGMKSIQLANTETGWKISAIAWDDEREGVVIPVLPGGMAWDSTDGDMV